MRGKLVVVTGAASGIGAGVVQRMLDEGGIVAAVDVDEDGLQAWRRAAEAGRTVRPTRADVTDRSQLESALGDFFDQFGGCDALVNAAGITSSADPLEISEEEWDRVIDVNLKGTFLCAQIAGRAMQERGGGSIVNISSIATELVTPLAAHYAASKGGVRSLTKGLAVGLAPYNIRVNAVGPGPTATAMGNNEIFRDDAHTERMLGRVLRGRMAEPADIAAAVLFLASDEADFITGATLYADGGVLAVR